MKNVEKVKWTQRKLPVARTWIACVCSCTKTIVKNDACGVTDGNLELTYAQVAETYGIGKR